MYQANSRASNGHSSDISKDCSPLGAQTATRAAPTSPSSWPAAGARSGCVKSPALLGGEKPVKISHNGSPSRLQAPRLGKLILTK